MYNKYKRTSLLIAVLLSLFLGQAFAQQNTYSAYSRFGIGDLSPTGFTNQLAMGGWSLGYSDSLALNFDNIADYANLRRAIFSMGMNARLINSEAGSISQENNTSGLGFIGLGMPVGDWGGLVFSLKPYSSVGYLLTDQITDSLVGQVDYHYEGSGGLNQASIGFAASPVKGLSLGLNFYSKFGALERFTTVDYDTSTFLDTRIVNRVQVNDVGFGFGAQYKLKLSDKLSANFAVAYDLQSDLNASRERVVYTYDQVAGREIPKDTSQFENGLKGSVVLPSELKLGFGLHSRNHWGFGADFYSRDWANYSSFGESDNLAASYGLSIGAYITPNPDAVRKYYQAITYRAGFHYNNSYLELRNNQIKDVGISFGVSLPIKRSLSKLNLAVTAGRRGTTELGLIQENYLNFSLGLSLNDRWFVKRKID